MHVPRIWERATAEGKNDRGHAFRAFGWGWSETDQEEARQKAKSSAQRIVNWLISSDEDRDLHHYGYDERLPREEIIDEYTDGQGTVHGYVSRNAYGALILNTRDLMFIDIDLPPEKKPNPLSLFAALFGKKPAPFSRPEDVMLDEITATASQHAELGFRVYRTYNGFRLMVANRKLLPNSELSQQLLAQFKSDPLYVRMCKNQQCFRARLTPKAWRCKIKMPTERFPFSDAQSEASYRKWEQTYSDGTRNFSTCDLVKTIGPMDVHPDIEGLVAIHDQLTKSSLKQPLA